jgi:MoxR-like ATPase
LIQLHLGYPDFASEVDVLYAQVGGHPVDELEPVLSRAEVLALQRAVEAVHVERNVAEYLVRLARETRGDGRLKLGVSPRGVLMLFRAAKAAAFAAGREFVLPDDVQLMAPYVLAHRVVLTSKAKYASTTREEIIRDLLDRVPVPT